MWLKKHYPAICVKSGLCDKIGGRLYTITRLETYAEKDARQAADRIESLEAMAGDMEKLYNETMLERDSLAVQLQECRKDAERYRWLREQPASLEPGRIDVVQWVPADDASNDGHEIRLENLDAAIDAAMSQEKAEHDQQ